jgi:hypothetical protein
MRNAKTEDEAKKTEVAVVLLEAYASLTCCCILYITSAVPNIFINQALYLNCLLRPCHTIAYRTSVCQRMKNITHTPVYADIR